MKIVTPFRPFPPESEHHQKLGPFDWADAVRMLRASAAKACGCDTFLITDVDTPAIGQTYAYATTHRRLMLWILDVSLAYLRSNDFDQDTALVSPDVLVFGDPRPYFTADLSLLVRTGEKFRSKPEKQILNSVQWWRVDAKARLIDFYQHALALAITLPEDRITWGADTDPLVALAAPVVAGRSDRAGVSFFGVEMSTVMTALTAVDQSRLRDGRAPHRPRHVFVDFKYGRKAYMRRYFETVIGSAVAA